MTVYVLIRDDGQWEDNYRNVEGVYSSQEKAEQGHASLPPGSPPLRKDYSTRIKGSYYLIEEHEMDENQ
jgi:hypothetical protein